MAEKILLSGNDAVAKAAMDAGISAAIAYPGTPSTEILEYIAKKADENTHVEWSVNEKVALETAAGAAYSGVRVICSMKHVGVNVAADPLMTFAYTGVRGGTVIVAADDPGMHSSQSEQDSRYFAKFAKLPCFEPYCSQEAYDMVREIFNLSEEFELPIILKTLTRVAHTSSPVKPSKTNPKTALGLDIDAKKRVMIPAYARMRHKDLNLKQESIKEYIESSEYNKIIKKRGTEKEGIICFGSAYNYAKEVCGERALMKVSTYPFPEKKIVKFISELETVFVFEEGEPLLEEFVGCRHKNTLGKISGHLPLEGELSPESCAAALGETAQESKKCHILLPPRPPKLCQGCPHTSLYNALKKAGPSVVAGDIGCYTLGVNMGIIHTCLCMGAGINIAAGMSHSGNKKVAAVIGESTFLHSGITGLINSVYNKADILLFILDNSTVAMTGHQPTPFTGVLATGKHGGKVNLEKIIEACNVDSLDVIDPYREKNAEELIKKRLDEPGVKVIISRAPCIFVKKREAKK